MKQYTVTSDSTTNSKGTLLYALRKELSDDIHITFARHVTTIDFTNIQAKGKNGYLDRTMLVQKSIHNITITGPVTILGGRLEFLKLIGNVVLESVTIRIGTKNLKEGVGKKMDCIYGTKCNSIILRNCSFSWNCDECLSFDDCQQVIIDKCLIAEPLHVPTVKDKGEQFIHPEGSFKDHGGTHGYGIRCSGCQDFQIINCIIADCAVRSPQISSENMRGGVYNYLINNSIIYNYGHAILSNNNYKNSRGTMTLTVTDVLFVPGTRTAKGNNDEVPEFDLETINNVDFTFVQKNNKLLHYEKMLLQKDGKEQYLNNEPGPNSEDILNHCGNLLRDIYDTEIISRIRKSIETKAIYDNLHDEPRKWVEWIHSTKQRIGTPGEI